MNKTINYYGQTDEMDRRERPRFRVSANCSFQYLDPNLYYDDYNIYKIENIGLGGMAFLSEKPYDLNTRLFVIIAIQDSSILDPINAIGEVTWINHSKSIPYQYLIGIRFTNILQDDLISLTDHFHAKYNINTGENINTGAEYQLF